MKWIIWDKQCSIPVSNAIVSINNDDDLCGSRIYDNIVDYGLISSPVYSNNIDCQYRLSCKSTNNRIHIEFVFFETEGCCDYLEIIDQTRSLR